MNSSSSTSGPLQWSVFSSFAVKGKEFLQRWKYLIAVTVLIVMVVVTAIVLTNQFDHEETDEVEQLTSSNNPPNVTARESNDSLSSWDSFNYAFNEIASNMNSSVDPCDDFYEYACGSFPKRYPIPRGKIKINYQDIYTDRVYRTMVDRLKSDEFLSSGTSNHLKYLKRIWDSCVNENPNTSLHMKKLQMYFKELDKLNSWQEKFVKLTKDGYNLLFTIKISGTPQDLTQVIISPPKLNWEKMYAANTHLLMEYYEHLAKKVLEETVYDLKNSAVAMMEFEHGLVMKSISGSEKLRSPLLSSMTVQELSSRTGIDWHKLLNKMFRRINFDKSSRIYIDYVEYDEQFNFLKGYLQDDFLGRYFKVAVFLQSCFFISDDCRHLQFNLFNQTESILVPKYKDESQFIEDQCFDFLVDNFEDLMYNVWDSLALEVVQERSRQFKEIINTLTAEFGEMIRNQITWMDEETRSQVLKNFIELKFTTSIQAPYFVHQNFNLGRAYKKAPFFDSTDKVELYDYFRGVIKWTKEEVFSVGVFKDVQTWPISLFSILPFFDQESRSFFVPDFFVQGPFYAGSLHDSIKFGFYGSMLAHEITHSFDSVADSYCVVHGKEPFWTEWTRSSFNDKFKCLVDAYEEEVEVFMYGDETVTRINGTFSLGENLADLIGLNVAFKTFKQKGKVVDFYRNQLPNSLRNLTDEQMFFLSYANVHCSNRMKPKVALSSIIEPPPKFLVNLPLAHTKEFWQQFNCKPGARMNPHGKCSFK